MKWFKHYSNAAENRKVDDLMEEFGPDEGYAMWFKFVELCASTMGDRVDKVDRKLRISATIVRRKLRKSTTKVERFLDVCTTNSLLSWKKVEKFYEIDFPKLLELMGKDEKYRRKKGEQLSLEEKRVNNNRIEESRETSLSSFFSVQQSKMAPDIFVQEFGQDVINKGWLDSVAYFESKEMKKPFGQFMYESLDRTRQKFGSQKSIQAELEIAAKELGIL